MWQTWFRFIDPFVLLIIAGPKGFVKNISEPILILLQTKWISLTCSVGLRQDHAFGAPPHPQYHLPSGSFFYLGTSWSYECHLSKIYDDPWFFSGRFQKMITHFPYDPAIWYDCKGPAACQVQSKAPIHDALWPNDLRVSSLSKIDLSIGQALAYENWISNRPGTTSSHSGLGGT